MFCDVLRKLKHHREYPVLAPKVHGFRITSPGLNVGYPELDRKRRSRTLTQVFPLIRCQPSGTPTAIDLAESCATGWGLTSGLKLCHQRQWRSDADATVLWRVLGDVAPREIVFGWCRQYALGQQGGKFITHAKAQKLVQVDPVRVDPKHYSVELENDQVRVLRIKYGAPTNP